MKKEQQIKNISFKKFIWNNKSLCFVIGIIIILFFSGIFFLLLKSNLFFALIISISFLFGFLVILLLFFNTLIYSDMLHKVRMHLFLGSGSKKGIVVSGETNFINKNKIVGVVDNTNGIVIGTTGTGKTRRVIMPTIMNCGASKTKPSLIISDPKKETYNKTKDYLKNQGYKIKILNLIDDQHSEHWNPLYIVWKEKEKMIKKYENEKFKFSYFDKIFSSLHSFLYDLKQIRESKDDFFKQQGFIAIELFTKILLFNPKTKAKDFNLHKIYKLLNARESEINKIIEDISKTSYGRVWVKETKIKNALAKILDNNNTNHSIILSGQEILSWLTKNQRLNNCMAYNDINFEGFRDEPIALFFSFSPTESKNYAFLSILVKQIYKTLEKYTPTENRDVYFMLDEFGNMPQINDFANIISVCRSYKIWFLLVLNNITQLNKAYGKHDHQNIFSNCNLKLYLGSGNKETWYLLLSEFNIKNQEEEFKKIRRLKQNEVLVSYYPKINNEIMKLEMFVKD